MSVKKFLDNNVPSWLNANNNLHNLQSASSSYAENEISFKASR